MCGILIVKSKYPISKTIHDQSVQILKRRGPDFTIEKYVNDCTFIAQSVLHITGEIDFYRRELPDGFAFNGEIYNYRDFGNWVSDVDLVYDAVKTNLNLFKDFEGAWAWGLANNDGIFYASDPQGEKSLYQYQDEGLLVVCSDIAPILNYIDSRVCYRPYQNKSWTFISNTPWQGITRCEPGMMYHNGNSQRSIDSMWDWISVDNNLQFNEAYEELRFRFNKVANYITANEPAQLSYSGGVDSSILLKLVKNLDPLAIDINGKDSIVDSLDCKKIKVDELQWAEEYKNLLHDSKMPVSSWSFVGSYILAKKTKHRIIFTGIGADELFGGYDVYKNLNFDNSKSVSPYSEHDHDNLWIKCLNVYNGDAKLATLLMDYWYQIVGCDAYGQDIIGGICGKETRNFFLTKSIMKFALNLPWHLKVGYETKPLLKKLYRDLFKTDMIYPKKGFAGHANDSLPYLGINIHTVGDRHRDWISIAQETYYSKFKIDTK